MRNLMKLSEMLRIEIERNGTTVAKLSRAAKVPSKTLYNWLGGQPPRDIEQLMRVARVLKVTLDELCSGEASPKKTKIEEMEREINAGLFEVVLRKVNR